MTRMRSGRMLAAVAAAGGLGLSLLAGCGGGVDAAALLSTRCGSCHTLTVVTTTKQSKAAWETTVTRMVKRGAQLTKEEQTALVDYLAKTYAP